MDRADDTAAKVSDAGGIVVLEPSDLLDASRMAVVADWAGTGFGLWQPGAHKGARLVNEPGACALSQLTTRGTEGARAF